MTDPDELHGCVYVILGGFMLLVMVALGAGVFHLIMSTLERLYP
jgi:hypothetical protein